MFGLVWFRKKMWTDKKKYIWTHTRYTSFPHIMDMKHPYTITDTDPTKAWAALKRNNTQQTMKREKKNGEKNETLMNFRVCSCACRICADNQLQVEKKVVHILCLIHNCPCSSVRIVETPNDDDIREKKIRVYTKYLGSLGCSKMLYTTMAVYCRTHCVCVCTCICVKWIFTNEHLLIP